MSGQSALDFLNSDIQQPSALAFLNAESAPNVVEESQDQPMSLNNFSNAFMKGYGQLGAGILGAGPDIAQAVGLRSPEESQSDKELIAKAIPQLESDYPTHQGFDSFVGSGLGQAAPALLMGGAPAYAASGLLGTLANEDPAASGIEKLISGSINVPASMVLGKTLEGAQNLLSTGASKVLNYAKGVKSPLVNAYDAVGVTPSLVGDVTQNPSLQLIQGSASKLPFGAGQIAREASKGLDQFGNAVSSLADKYNPNVQTLEDAGNVIQDNIPDWLNAFKKTSTNKYNKLDNVIGDAPTNLVNTSNYLDNIQGAAKDNPAMQDFLTSDIAKRFKDVLAQSDQQNAPVGWNTLKGLRTRVGEYLENPSLIPDAGGAQLKGLYGALSQDMRDTAETRGPIATNLLNDANAYTTQGHEFIDNVLKPIQNKDPGQAASYLVNSGTTGGTKLAALRDQMPDSADALSALTLRRALAGPFNGTSNSVTPERWLSALDPSRRLSPEAAQALYPNPSDQATISALNTVAGSMKNSTKYANPSGTAGQALTAAELTGPFAGAAMGFEHGGIHGALAGFGLGSVPIAAGYGAGKISANETLARLLSTPVNEAKLSPFNAAMLKAALANATSLTTSQGQ